MPGSNGPLDTAAVGRPVSGDVDAPAREVGTAGRLDVPAVVRAARRQLLAVQAHDSRSGRFVGSAAPSRGPGADSRQLDAALGPLREQLYRQALADQGHNETDAPVTLMEAERSLSSLSVLEESFWQYIVERGPITSKGKTTAAVSRLLAVVDRKLKIIALLGLARRQREGLTLSQVLAEHAAHETDPASPFPQHDKHDTTGAASRGAEGDDTP
jgi:hypothetical protein